jgi:MFS family permease
LEIGLIVTKPDLVSARHAVPGARMALFLLISINIFNYLDRQVLAAIEPQIEKDILGAEPIDLQAAAQKLDIFSPGHKDAEFWSGLLSTAFLVTYMVTAPLFGFLADRMSRWALIGIGVIIWSLASAASGWEWPVGLSTAYYLLLMTRCLVGVGEAAYGPVAPTIISDLFPIESRGRIMAYFYMAIPVGGALGYALGGLMADSSLGWRWAFYLVLPPGLLLGLWCFLMPEIKPGQAEAVIAEPTRPAALKDYLALLKIPSFLLDTLGMTAMTFAMGGLAYFMPKYLLITKLPALVGSNAVFLFGVIIAVAGFVATLLGGSAGDLLRNRFSGSYFLVSGSAMLLGFPMVLLVLWFSPSPWAWLFIFMTVFCLFFNTGPTNTILANVTHPTLRASAFAFNILIIHLFGDAISPPLIGLIAARAGLDVAFGAISATMLVGGVIWIIGAKFLQQDTENAPMRALS